VRRFASRDEPPLQLTVHVLRIVKSDFDTWLTEQSQSIADPPQLTVSTDQRRYRRGDILNLLVTVDVASSAQRQTVDASLALVWPDGREVILGEGGLVPFIRGRLEPRFRAVQLRQWIGRRAAVPIALQSAEMPYGPYTVYLLLTEPNTSNVIAKAKALFSLEP
jgi:hypothetical protein